MLIRTMFIVLNVSKLMFKHIGRYGETNRAKVEYPETTVPTAERRWTGRTVTEMAEYKCDSCAYGPPTSCDGRPCCACDPYDPVLSCYNPKIEPKRTNSDRIRAMSDEELADKLWSVSHYTQKKQKVSDWLDWLKQEAET